MSARPAARTGFRAGAEAVLAARLTCRRAPATFATVKSTAIIFCFFLALVKTAAQEVITPTHRIELFNGKNFSGWTFCMNNHADPLMTWSVTNGLIHCTGKPSGYIRTIENYSNYVLTLEWRFLKVAPQADNSGVLFYIQPPDKVWPRCIQNQGKSGRQGDLILMAGAECKEHLALGKDASTPVALRGEPNENPVGEWNTNVTICAGNDVKAIINGKWLNEITECTVSSGFIGIQSEGGDIEIRTISLAPLK
jgi:Domain of Unknown Function (DUF1080)